MPDIDRTSGIPAYRQIADTVRSRIRSGVLVPETRLDSETTLARDYDVSRATVRQAIDLLESEGLVETKHGKGTFVRRWEPWEYEPARHLTKVGKAGRATWKTEGERQGRETVMEILGISVEDYPPVEVREALGTEPLLCRRKREWVDGVPIAWYESWFPWSVVAGTHLEEMVPVEGGMLDYIETEIGLELCHFVEHLSVRNPTPEEASNLQLGPGIPVLVVRLEAYTPAPNLTGAIQHSVVHVDVKVIAGNAVTLLYELPAHEA